MKSVEPGREPRSVWSCKKKKWKKGGFDNFFREPLFVMNSIRDLSIRHWLIRLHKTRKGEIDRDDVSSSKRFTALDRFAWEFGIGENHFEPLGRTLITLYREQCKIRLETPRRIHKNPKTSRRRLRALSANCGVSWLAVVNGRTGAVAVSVRRDLRAVGVFSSSPFPPDNRHPAITEESHCPARSKGLDVSHAPYSHRSDDSRLAHTGCRLPETRKYHHRDLYSIKDTGRKCDAGVCVLFKIILVPYENSFFFVMSERSAR